MTRNRPFKKVHSQANTMLRKSASRGKHQYWISALLLALVCAVSVGFIVWYRADTNAKLADQDRSLQESLRSMDTQISAARQRREAEKQAKLQAAASTAEQAKTVTSVDDAVLIDSRSCSVSSTHNSPASIDVVVNKKNCLQPITYEPDDLRSAYGATLNAPAIDAYINMYNAAAQADLPFSVTSSYRSYASQITTYRYWVATSGYDEADTYSSRPGYSEHQTGLAIDVAADGCVLDCFGTTAQYTWLQAHAAEYGFVQRYYAGYEAKTGYKAEEWHYRYVGIAVAQDMKARGIKTLEEYWSIDGGDY